MYRHFHSSFLRASLFILSLSALLLNSCSSSRSGGASGSKEDRFRSEVVDFADQFQGIKYKYAGKSPKTGFDCSGFTSYVMKHFNIELSPSSKMQEKQGKKIRVSDVKPGDLIFYRRSSMGKVFHVSLVVSNKRDGITVIHSVSRGVVKENISTSSYWKPKISSARDVISK